MNKTRENTKEGVIHTALVVCQVSVYSRKGSNFWVWHSRLLVICFPPISKSSDIIAYSASSCSRPSRIALPNFVGIVSFPCNGPNPLAATFLLSPRRMPNPSRSFMKRFLVKASQIPQAFTRTFLKSRQPCRLLL